MEFIPSLNLSQGFRGLLTLSKKSNLRAKRRFHSISMHESGTAEALHAKDEYILCLLMRKRLRDKWLQTAVSQGQQHTEQLPQTFFSPRFSLPRGLCNIVQHRALCLTFPIKGAYCNGSKIPNPCRDTSQKTEQANKTINQIKNPLERVWNGVLKASKGMNIQTVKRSAVHPAFK